MSEVLPSTASGHDQYAGLRAHAATTRQDTVARLRSAIAVLEERHAPVTLAAIKTEAGLDSTTILRNPDAHALFAAHSTHLQAKRQAARRRRKTPAPSDAPEPATGLVARDPLLRQAKPTLVAALRTAHATRDEAERRYATLLQDHAQCGITIMTLTATVGRYEEFLGRYRSSLLRQEHRTEH